MPNSIALFKNYVPILDEVYREASRSAVLDGAPELARAGANAGELIIPKMTMDGLADYARASGYVDGDVTLTNETVLCNFDRGRMFTVDALDDAETAGIAFGRLASEFIRTRVVPELDAFRFACYAAVSGIGSASGTLADGASVVAALRAAASAMDEAEVPMEGRFLFITPPSSAWFRTWTPPTAARCSRASTAWFRCPRPVSTRPLNSFPASAASRATNPPADTARRMPARTSTSSSSTATRPSSSPSTSLPR